jgi:hypothetical protein
MNCPNEYLNNEVELRKALGAPESVSDLHNTSGGVLTKRSQLNKGEDIAELSLSEDEALDFLEIVLSIKDRKIPATESGILEFCKDADTGRKIISLINKYFTGVKK